MPKLLTSGYGPALSSLRFLLLAYLACACGSASVHWEPSWPGFSDGLRDSMRLARERMDADDWEGAYVQLAPLVAQHEELMHLGVWLQEVELELLARGSTFEPEIVSRAATSSPQEALREHYSARASDRQTAVSFLLAARIEDDAFSALHLIDEALEADPEEAWAHYAKAHATLALKERFDRWKRAWESLRRALAIDPGLLPARRLEAWMFAQEGSLLDARNALTLWLERSRGDPRVSLRERREGELDLALVLLLDGDPTAANAILSQLEGTDVARDRRLMVLAAAQQALGNAPEALFAARRAEHASFEKDVLPLVQQAILYEYWLEDAAAAEATWRRVVERAQQFGDLSDWLQAMRAQVILDRYEAERRGEATEIHHEYSH